MKKLSLLLIALLAGAICMQVEAQPQKARRTQIYTTLPDGYQQLDDSKMYYNIGNRWFAGVTRLFSSDGPGYQYAISILGEIDDSYYASTYGDDERDDGCGSGFLAAFKIVCSLSFPFHILFLPLCIVLCIFCQPCNFP